ncbi:MAG: hypothetical protein QOJ81_422 [Chloroflexota bacterium]|nr:hypothetical protein [Chloroflexota bacterium]
MSIVVSLIMLAAALVAPAPIGATPAPDYGAVGKCRYEITEWSGAVWTEAELRRVAVTPPQLFSHGGTQMVGWRFVVRRSLDRENGPWQVTYRSPIQKGSATTSSAADLHTMRVDVPLPQATELEFVHYTVALKLFWFNANGSVQSKVGHPMSSLHLIVDHEDNGGDDDFCPGLAQQFFEP